MRGCEALGLLCGGRCDPRCGETMTCAINGRSLRDGAYEKGGGPAAILIHPGAYPSSLIDCVRVGRREGDASKQPAARVLEILGPCGGSKEGRTVLLTVRAIRPAMPNMSRLLADPFPADVAAGRAARPGAAARGQRAWVGDDQGVRASSLGK